VTEGAKEGDRGSGGISVRVAAWLAWSALAVTTVFSILVLFMPSEQNGLEITVPLAAWAVTSSAVGALIVSRRPENPVGWLLGAIGFLVGAGTFFSQYAFYAQVGRTGALPGGGAAAWLATWPLALALGLFTYLFVLFPEGRLLSPRWRWILWLSGAAIAAATLSEAFMPGPIEGLEPVQNPLGIEGAGDVLSFVSALADFFYAALLITSALSVFLRLRRAKGDERQQLKWLAYAAALLAGVAALGVVIELSGGAGWWFFVVILISLLGIPVAIGVAILRHRLYDIDLLINRTLVYGSLTAALVALYFGAIVVLQRLFVLLTGEKSTLAVVASTLVIAALFTPLRGRIQSFIDRRFYRRKYDARKTLAAYSATLRDETDLEALNNELVGVVTETMQPAHVFVWLRPDSGSKEENEPAERPHPAQR
jgi:hypothetical protein